MNVGATETRIGGPAVSIGCDRINMRIPFVEAGAEGGFIDEELLPRVGQYFGTTWVIDLSEYEGGLTLSAVGILVRLGEEARCRKCAVMYSGLGGSPMY